MQPTSTDPFDRLRARYMAAMALAVTVVVAVVAALAGVPEESLQSVWLYVVVFALLCPALVWWGTRHGLDFRRVFGPVPREVSVWAAAFAPLLAVLGVASLLMVAVGIWSFIAPELAVKTINDPNFGAPDSFDAGADPLATLIATVLVAPIAEEFVFRGLLMQRWIRKWGMMAGVLASSALFGALHLTYAPLAFVTGLMLALLYLATGSLWVPIVAHALNNAFVSLIDLAPERSLETVTLTELRGGMFASVVFAVLCAMALYRLRSHLWPSGDAPLPYQAGRPGEAPPEAPLRPSLPAQANYLIVLHPTRLEMLTEGATPEEAELVQRHFARLETLARAGTVRIAGRTTENDDRTVGIILVSASSEEEAREIMLDDPAVQGGVMTAELHPFRVAVAG